MATTTTNTSFPKSTPDLQALATQMGNDRDDVAKLYSSVAGTDLSDATDLPAGGVKEMHADVTTKHGEVAANAADVVTKHGEITTINNDLSDVRTLSKLWFGQSEVAGLTIHQHSTYALAAAAAAAAAGYPDGDIVIVYEDENYASSMHVRGMPRMYETAAGALVNGRPMHPDTNRAIVHSRQNFSRVADTNSPAGTAPAVPGVGDREILDGQNIASIDNGLLTNPGTGSSTAYDDVAVELGQQTVPVHGITCRFRFRSEDLFARAGMLVGSSWIGIYMVSMSLGERCGQTSTATLHDMLVVYSDEILYVILEVSPGKYRIAQATPNSSLPGSADRTLAPKIGGRGHKQLAIKEVELLSLRGPFVESFGLCRTYLASPAGTVEFEHDAEAIVSFKLDTRGASGVLAIDLAENADGDRISFEVYPDGTSKVFEYTDAGATKSLIETIASAITAGKRYSIARYDDFVFVEGIPGTGLERKVTTSVGAGQRGGRLTIPAGWAVSDLMVLPGDVSDVVLGQLGK